MSIVTYKSRIVLPEEYQEVEYIQGSGTQYIDTLVKLSSSDTIKAKFELNSIPTSYAEGVYGTLEYISGNTFFVLLMRTPNLARVGTSSNQVTSTNVATNTIYDTTLSNGTYIENGTTYTFTPSDAFTFTKNCYVFLRNQDNMTPIDGKFYSFEIVGKFKGIPCYRKADGVIGMYDLVSEVFFTNAGTGTFTKGNDVEGGFEVEENEIVLFSQSIQLPNTYQRVEYIESSGTQYIQTSISVTDTDRLEFDIMPTHSTFEYEEVLGTDWTGSLTTNIAFYMWSGLTHYFSSNGATLSNWQQDTLYNIKFLDEYGRIVRNDSVQATLSPSSTGVTSNNLNIFGTESGHRFVGRLYSLTITDNNNDIIHQLVPCYRKSDDEIGLYDTITDVFYTNAGSGTFTKGSNFDEWEVKNYEIVLFRQNPDAHNLPIQYQEVEYVESTGTQYIDSYVVGKYGLSTNAKIIVTDNINANSVLLGSRTVDGATSPTRIYLGYRQFDGTVNIGYRNELTSNTQPEQNVLHTYEYNLTNGYAKIKQDGVEIFSQAIEPNFSNGANLFIFANNYVESSVDSYIACKLYELKIYDTDTLIRDFIPCYRKIDNEIGLYDIVNDVFYTNAGTGAFLKGNNINNNFEIIKI